MHEVGRAGRKPGTIANWILYFNEVVDDKRLGLWLKLTLSSTGSDKAAEADKKNDQK